ncbi:MULTISPECIES: PaaI family thioesterase [Rhodomicrobium]|uniref:PaaI family thioesterase n=1 Tax=Rhodomicrobium TaxID=1068 RepID=UPI000B4C1E08|nr:MULTISPECIES: PaaI family thioesterase [Rhodomicrobium]
MIDPALASFPLPPSAKLLGWRLISVDPEAGELEVGFEGKPEFLNPAGVVQGGILTAMLDDTMGPLILIMTKGRLFGATIELHTQFLHVVRPGPITVKARITQLGKRIAFVEGQLFNPEGQLAARATASASLIEGLLPPVPAR